MTIPWVYFLLAIIQGIFEWLPVSSEGQIVIVVVWLLGQSLDEAVALAIFLHFGTMFVVIGKYREDTKRVLSELRNELRNFKMDIFRQGSLTRALFLASIGTVITGLPILLIIRIYGEEINNVITTLLIALILLVTVFVLYIQEQLKTENDSEDSSNEGKLRKFVERLDQKSTFDELNWKIYVFLGMVQGFAIIPGVSRSGVTITFLLLIGVKGVDALRGSFLISVPATAGAILLGILLGDVLLTQNGIEISGNTQYTLAWIWVLLGIILTFIISWLTISALLRFASKYKMWKLLLILTIFPLVSAILLLIYS